MRPKFYNVNCHKKDFIREDGTKPCFMFSRYDKVDEFSHELIEKIDSPCIKSSHLGYKVIYVPEYKYENAIIEGLKLILNNNSYKKAGVTWMNYYNERTSWGYVQILEFNLDTNKLAASGGWKNSTKRRIKRWNQKLEDALDMEIEVDEYLGKARFLVPRTSASHLQHDIILNKLRKNSELFERTPFSEYAMLDYFGKFVEL